MQLRITKIEPKRFWAPKYDESTTEDILRRCYKEILLIQKNLDLPDGYWEGYCSHTLINYVREAHAVEGSLSNTVAYDQMERIMNNIDTPADIHELFPPKRVQPGFDFDKFLPELSKSIHRSLMAGLLNDEDLGVYRTVHLKPAGEALTCMIPEKVQQSIDDLFLTIRTSLKKAYEADGVDQLEQVVMIAAHFFGHFLYIHPFRNGNGRVARLLLSFIMSRYTVVPMSLYVSSNPTEARKIYHECLREGRMNHDYHDYALLATLILDSLHRSTREACSSLDLYES